MFLFKQRYRMIVLLHDLFKQMASQYKYTYIEIYKKICVTHPCLNPSMRMRASLYRKTTFRFTSIDSSSPGKMNFVIKLDSKQQ